ncbi:MAG: PPOX class F420-dependent oxidoreductase [Ilumatobacteraceae bacterium]|nr:PPOX class F420-dependent oxidoreductase [Ilumatobacteraceae bacterium]
MSVMSTTNEKFLAILQSPYTGVLTTLFPDGSPQSTPVWFLLDGDDILFSTTAGAQKLRNITVDARATFAVYNPTDDMSYVEVRGAIEISEDPTADTRDRIVQKHGYVDGSAFDAPGTQRFTLRLRPTKITGR